MLSTWLGLVSWESYHQWGVSMGYTVTNIWDFQTWRFVLSSFASLWLLLRLITFALFTGYLELFFGEINFQVFAVLLGSLVFYSLIFGHGALDLHGFQATETFFPVLWLVFFFLYGLCVCVSFKNFILFNLFWLRQVLVAACRIFDLYCGMWTLSCSMWDLSPWSGNELMPSALGACSLSHWSIKEVLVCVCVYLTDLISEKF